MSQIKAFFKKYVPRWAIISLATAVVSAVVLAFATAFTPFADFINSTVGEAVRIALAGASAMLPFSIFELMLILLIPLTVAVIIMRRKKGRAAHPLRVIFSLVGIISVIASSYVFTLGVGYHTTPIDGRLGISEDRDISEEELYLVADYLLSEVNDLALELELDGGESRLGCSSTELSLRLVDAYESFLSEYPIFKGYKSRVKPVFFSTVMSDAGITGIYSFFTGEANLNTEYPDYTHPFTAAHELAHQRGIARENEANFVAFLVCIHSDDPYIRYSGYLNMLEYVASALYRTNEDSYRELIGRLNSSSVSDIRAASSITAAHRDSWFNKLNDFLNDTYLKANGTEGVVSYGYVVRLAVGYYTDKTNFK